jgi:caffeoyl-CoA O-methyltransferase
MLHAHAEVATSTPDRYIKQLVSHLGHRANTALNPDGSGMIDVGDGRCTLTSRGEMLVLEASADDAKGLAHVQDVAGRHLERFGARAAVRVHWENDGPAVPA